MLALWMVVACAPADPQPTAEPVPVPSDRSGCEVNDFASLKANVAAWILVSSTGTKWVFSYPPAKHDGVMRPPAPGEKRYEATIDGDAVVVKHEGTTVRITATATQGELTPAVQCHLATHAPGLPK